MIAIIDYGMGNLRSVQKAFQFLGYDASLTDDPQRLIEARGIVLPGVGAFADAKKAIEQKGLFDVIKSEISNAKPFFGICLGMQLLFESSEEGGKHDGFGLFPGVVKKLPLDVKIPHMGWNNLNIKAAGRFYKDISKASRFYFVHSFYVQSNDDSIVASTTDYGVEFVSSIAKENVFACQFHPEKSGEVGLKLLDEFARLCK